ncbi:MAG: hypothetical protein M3Y13_05010, partial [Armatimonadota bacterium]|nr:hypothetical protein [Armatimonadota bacterium]
VGGEAVAVGAEQGQIFSAVVVMGTVDVINDERARVGINSCAVGRGRRLSACADKEKSAFPILVST